MEIYNNKIICLIVEATIISVNFYFFKPTHLGSASVVVTHHMVTFTRDVAVTGRDGA